MDWVKFFADAITSGVTSGARLISGVFESYKKTNKAKDVLHELFDEGFTVTADEFLNMYDTRTYDVYNHQHDIKIMKKCDFKGVYIIHNRFMGSYYVGKGDRVLRKISRHFNGYGNSEVYRGYKENELLYVRVIPFENSGYDDIDDLERAIRKRYKNRLIS